MSCHRERSAAGDMRVSVCGSAPLGGSTGPSSEMRRPVIASGVPAASGAERLRFSCSTAACASASVAAHPIATATETGCASSSLAIAQLTGDPVALDAVVEPRRHDDEVLGHPGAGDCDALPDERLGRDTRPARPRRPAAGPPRWRPAASNRCRSRGRAATARARRRLRPRSGRAPAARATAAGA